MGSRFVRLYILILVIGFTAACSGWPGEITREPDPGPLPTTTIPSVPTTFDLPTLTPTVVVRSTPGGTTSPSALVPSTPTKTVSPFEVGQELTIDYLRQVEISGSEISWHEELPANNKYQRHIVSYRSQENRIYGLLTIPLDEPPQGGYKAIVFNHGYIPPTEYQTTERYEAYVDYLARSGFVVFKIDYRGHGKSEGEPSGTYFSPAYTFDAIAALKSLQRLEIIDPQGIGMWGHSMAGNLVLRAMLIETQIQAGVIWAGAVYSYDDFVKYGISDNTYRPPPTPEDPDEEGYRRRSREIFEAYGSPDRKEDFWRAVSLSEHIEYLSSPLQIHHAEDDPVVNIAYSYDLVDVLQAQDKVFQFFTYEGGGHNLESPYFDQAMIRTVQFFRDNLSG